MKKNSRKGRPRKDAITKLKVMAWFRAVAEASGKTSAQLEREFADPNHIRRSKDKNQEIRPGLWDKYRRGEVEPRSRSINENRVSVVQAVEAKYPGTARVLTLPLWKLLDFNQPVTMAELDAIEQTLPPEIRRLYRGENMLAEEFFQVGHADVTETTSSMPPLRNTINQWTMKVVCFRRAILLQQEIAIGSMQSGLGDSFPHNRKQRAVPPRKDSQPQIKTSQSKHSQARLF